MRAVALCLSLWRVRGGPRGARPAPPRLTPAHTRADIPDESYKFDDLDIDEDYYVPVIHLYFSDDLTVG